ncbi:alanine racemase [Lutibacter sp.]|uniref:alanine racemase n=1 Tax=Lutibacter sp. TaxID=1925666 RepID=UPI002735BEB2|nr:alanine racemase [Lutibacter sp.]MDP3314279.1 alanine racemase [Lutibacter sp.]
MENSHLTTLEIDFNAIDFNLSFFKKKLKKNTKILVVVKAFGYGSDAIEIAKHLVSKVDYFAVAYVEEGIALRVAGIKTPILVLHPQKQNLDKLIKYQLEPNIYSISVLNGMIESVEKAGLSSYPIHIKFNTGLNRLGFSEKDINMLHAILKPQKNVTVISVFSHIAASEDLNEREFTLHQINLFNVLYKKLMDELEEIPFKHMLNTSGIINYAKEAQFDMVRLGIGLYGFGNDSIVTPLLKNVVVLKSIISQIHTIKKGDSVGYNRAYVAQKTTKTATIPIGHADGYSRQFGNGIGFVYINNKKAQIVGNVCMDVIMVDVTNINCNEGDEVLVYKNQNHIEELSEAIKTIPYELLTTISQRVRRVLKNC